MRYDIEADWQLLNTCNYRCAYCFFPPAVLGEKLTVHGEPNVWRRAFDQTGLTWLLHITGGEPTIYPGFAELCQLLTMKHYLSFNSNLTHPSIVKVAKSVDPSRISFINAGLHPEERENRKGLTKFLEHAACLKERNFPVFISIVATPDVLSRVDEVIALTEPIGLTPIPKLLRGAYKGRIYPRAYRAKERSTFIEFATRARESYGSLLSVLSERPSIDIFGDENFVDGLPWFRGRMCSAGNKFVSLGPDGKIYRCQPKQSNYLGNLLDGSFRPRTGKSSCDSNYCFYFCLKYADGTAAWRRISSAPHHVRFALNNGHWVARK
jgi:MoaA/NifB/PqqE/SkfB family radical SAM enzyme